MGNPKPLTGDSSIADWLADPAGNAILTQMLAQSGQTPEVFTPVRRLAIKRLVKLSRGSFTQEMLDDLVARAAAGDVPGDATGAAPAVTAEGADGADDTRNAVLPCDGCGMAEDAAGVGDHGGRRREEDAPGRQCHLADQHFAGLNHAGLLQAARDPGPPAHPARRGGRPPKHRGGRNGSAGSAGWNVAL